MNYNSTFKLNFTMKIEVTQYQKQQFLTKMICFFSFEFDDSS